MCIWLFFGTKVKVKYQGHIFQKKKKKKKKNGCCHNLCTKGNLHEQNHWFRILNLVWNLWNLCGTEIVAYKHPPFSKNERQVLDIFVFFSSLNGTIKKNGMLFDPYDILQ